MGDNADAYHGLPSTGTQGRRNYRVARGPCVVRACSADLVRRWPGYDLWQRILAGRNGRSSLYG